MDRNGIAAVLLLFLIVADVSSASLIGKIRKLGDEARNDSPEVKEAGFPPPNPVADVKKPDLKVDDLGKTGSGAAVLDPKASGNRDSAIAPPQTESEKAVDASGKADSANSPPKIPTDSGKDANSNKNDKASDNKEEAGRGKSSNTNDSVETGKDNQVKEGEGKKKNDTDGKGKLEDDQTKEGEGKKKNGADNGPEGVQINEGKGKKENDGDDKSGPQDEQKKEGDDNKKNNVDDKSGTQEKDNDKGEDKKKNEGDDKSGLPDKDTDKGNEKKMKKKNEGDDKSGSQDEKTNKGDEKKKNEGDDKSGSQDTQKEGGDKKKSGSDDISGSQDKPKKEETKQKDVNDDKGAMPSDSTGTCNGVPRRCTDQNHLTACIKGIGSKELVVLVENDGEETLKVTFEVSTSTKYPQKLDVPKHETKKISISATSIQNGELVLITGHGKCVLHMDPPVPRGTFFYLPEYDKLLTPINGAYFLIATMLIFAATWACCKFRKRKRHLDGVPYQELEMGMPESISAGTAVETADSWDQVWDDDWDEEHAVKSPTVRHLGNISANGLTARSANKDGWENGWDD